MTGKCMCFGEEKKAYCLTDLCNDVSYRLVLTDDQVRLLTWLDDHYLLLEHEFIEWDDAFKNVGSI